MRGLSQQLGEGARRSSSSALVGTIEVGGPVEIDFAEVTSREFAVRDPRRVIYPDIRSRT